MGVTTALRPVEQSGRDRRVPEPSIFVVFGASGDLTRRKLLPALFHLRQAGLLSEEFAVVLLAKVRGGRVYPNKRVLVVGYALELICLQPFVTLNDGLAVYISRDDTSVSTRFLAALGQLSFLWGRCIHD